MQAETNSSRRLYRQIADLLHRGIDAGEFPPGSKLPPERELADRMGVSRPSVREALIALEVEGLVEVRVGSGVHVLDKKSPHRPASPVLRVPGPFDVIRARAVIEAEAAALAATHASIDQLQTLRSIVQQMRSVETHGADAMATDERFHMTIAEASGNAALVVVIQQLWELRSSPLYLQLESHFSGENIWRQAVDEHTELLNAIALRDPDGARAAMNRHMRNAEVRFGSGWRAVE